jgi:hypothetical protein
MAASAEVSWPKRVRVAATLALALAVAFASALAIFVLTSPLAVSNPFWIVEAIMSFVAAAAWMFTGLRIAPRHPAVGVLLFLPGAALSWFFSRGLLSTSSYYGLFSIVSACAGGALVWAIANRPQSSFVRRTALLLPLFTLLLAMAVALSKPALGVRVLLRDAKGKAMRVHMLVAGRAPLVRYLWTRDNGVIRAIATGPVSLEEDPGPAPSSLQVVLVQETPEVERVCNLFRQATRDLVQAEIAKGSIPSFLTALPFRMARCERGTVWEVHQ